MPKVSAVVPVYNGERFIRETVKSLLSQTFADLELLVVDDCSTDGTVEAVKEIGDPRLSLLSLRSNVGPSGAMSAGIEQSTGEYVARLDADDLAYPNRFEEQIRFLDSHPEVGLVCSYAKVFGSATRDWVTPADPDALRADLVFRNPVCHSTVTYRKSALEAGAYDPRRRNGDDYDAIVRVSQSAKAVCLPRFLVGYRKHATQISSNYDYAALGHLDDIFQRQAEGLGVSPSDEQLASHRLAASWRQVSLREVADISNWVIKLVKANDASHVQEPAVLRRIAAERLYEVCLRCSGDRRALRLGLTNPVTRANPGIRSKLMLRLLGVLRTDPTGRSSLEAGQLGDEHRRSEG